MLLVLDNEVDPDYRYFVSELTTYLDEYRVRDATAGDLPGPGDLDGVDGVILAGSTAGVYEADDHPWMDAEMALIRDLVADRVPTLGVCFGHQLINHALGGRVEHRGLTAELVSAEVADDPLLEGVPPVFPAVHGDVVVERGEGMEPLVSHPEYEHFGTRHRDAPVWTVQYHPEFTERLFDRVAGDFGWSENDLAFADAGHERTLTNFERLATRR